MKTVITYGTFDLFHEGHRRLLERAKALGDYLIVGVTTDHFDQERGKLNTHDSVVERIESVKNTGLADKIVIEEYQGQKIDDILKYDVDIFAIGSDWDGYFDYIKKYCEVVYLPRTEGVSSTQIRNERQTIRIGIVGTGDMAGRFVRESVHVSNLRINAVYNPDLAQARLFAQTHSISIVAETYGELLNACDAVYIASPYDTHFNYALSAIESCRHVLCEIPFVQRAEQASILFSLAEEKKVHLAIGLKTAYCPAFCHLIALIESKVIGEVVEIDAATTTLLEEAGLNPDIARLGGSLTENACFPLLPIFKVFGTDFKDVRFYSRFDKGTDIFTKALLCYEKGIASFEVGLGVKTEGDMTISGTKGYAYVPAPWWKTDYFELRYEDQNRNKRYFYPYDGFGLRYEIKDFINSILSQDFHRSPKLSVKEIIAMSMIIESFNQGINRTLI